MKVSVVVPNYNHARFLRRRMTSVLEQTFHDFEVIYLDDASQDQSDAVFAEFVSDARIRAFHNRTNSGSPFKQWNRGIREAHGEYVWIAEADDYADPRFLEVMVDALDRHPNAGIAVCKLAHVTENDTVFIPDHEKVGADNTRANDGRDATPAEVVLPGPQTCVTALFDFCMIPNASGVLIRTSVYRRAGDADGSMRQCGDWLQWAKMLLLADLVQVNQALSYFRTHSGSVRHKRASDGTLIRESYRVKRFIRARAAVEKTQARYSFEKLAESWMGATLCGNALSIRNHLAIMREALPADPLVLFRLAKKLLKQVFLKPHVERGISNGVVAAAIPENQHRHSVV